MRRKCLCLLSSLCLLAMVSTSFASHESLEGEWTGSTNAATHLQFYGNQIGCRTTDGADRYFQYTSAGTNALALYLGNDQEETVTYEQAGNTLTVTDTNQLNTTYTLTGQYTNLCKKALLQIVGAQGLCKQDDPTSVIIPLPQMLQYLQTMPVCPQGGTYLLQPGQEPACSSSCCNP